MKITFLLTWADEMGGTELATFTLAANLANHHDVDVVSVFRTKTERFFAVDERVPVRYLIDRTVTPERPIDGGLLSDAELTALAAADSDMIDPSWERTFNRLSDIELADALATLDTDVLVTTSPALMAAAVTYAPSKIRTIHQEHRPSQLRGPTGEPLLVYGPQLDALVSLTDRTMEWFKESFGNSAPDLRSIPNAGPAHHVPQSSLGSKSIVLARRLVPDKQVDHAIRAFAALDDEFSDWTLRIFGSGKEERRLRRLADDLNANDRVEFLGETRHMDDEWAKASLCLLPSRDGEAFPLVLLEAFAAGVPAIAYDISTGPAEIIRHRVDGLLVPAGHIEGLGSAMAELMRDPELLASMGAAAREGISRFSPEIITGKWLDMLTALTDVNEHDRRREKRRRAAVRAVSSGRRFATAVPAERLTPSDLPQQEREQQIAANNKRLVMSGGRLAECRDDVLAHEAQTANLNLVVDALRKAEIEHILVRDGSTQHRIAVSEDDQFAVMSAFASAFAGQAVYAELVAPQYDKPGAVLVESLHEVGVVSALRVFRPIVTTTRTLRYGPAFGCDVEFWARNETGDFVCPTRTTSAGQALPSITADATIEHQGHSYPTVSVFTRDLASDVSFPVDVVYTWVDDNDTAWRRERAYWQQAWRPDDDTIEADDARFRNRDELRYSMRSIAMFAPWVRHIYLVTAGQVPEWLDTTHKDVTVVNHRDIFVNSDDLPTFNSHAIETQLHHIPGLTNHFLYLNDDVFLARPIAPRKFFQSNGATRFFHTPTQIPMTETVESDNAYFAAAKNNRSLIENKFGRTTTHGFAHAPHPLRVDMLAEISETFAADVTRTASNRFRHPSDISMAASLHHHYSFFAGNASPGSIRCQYVDIGDYNKHPLLTRLLAVRGFDVFCLADSTDPVVPPAEQELVASTFLNAYYPVPAPWEKSDDT